MIDEDRDGRAEIELTLGAEGPQQVGRLRPQRTPALLTALAHEPELEGAGELEVVGPEVEQLLDSRAGVEQRREEGIVASPVVGRAIDGAEDGGDLLVLQVLHGPGAGALEGEAQDALRVLEAVGMLGRDVPEEGVNRGQANIARRGPAVARGFEVLEEGCDGLGGEVREVERRPHGGGGSP